MSRTYRACSCAENLRHAHSVQSHAVEETITPGRHSSALQQSYPELFAVPQIEADQCGRASERCALFLQ